MRAIAYSDVLQKAAEASGRIFVDLSVQEAGLFRGFIGSRLRSAWEAMAWPDLTPAERRFYRPIWSSGNYAQGTELFYWPTKKYYRRIASNLATDAPEAVAGAWAEALSSYAPADWDSTKAYVAGDQVFYPANGKTYQCWTAHTNQTPTTTAYWGELVPFDRYVAYEQSGQVKLGDVLGVWDTNPRIFANAAPVSWRLSTNGVQVFDTVPYVWVEHRVRAPFLKGANFSATAAYAVDEQIYFSQTSAAGNVTANFYDCLVATSAGDSPVSAAVKWSLVSVPYIFGEWLIHAAAADMLSKDGKDDWSRDEMTLAQEALLKELDKLERQQGQEAPFEVRVRQPVFG